MQTTATLPEDKRVWTGADERFMRRALDLAALGLGQVSPGPLVGCVIVSAAGEVVGEGFYVYEKLKHAETYALEAAGQQARGGTAYVSLEPHAHHGRTPPCTDALINAGVSRVVVPVEDPNPKVSGKGFAHLRAAGVEVNVGLLAAEARQLNEKYFHFMITGRPFLHLKLAMSLDGKIATRTGNSKWITGEASRRRVHELRHEYDAILVGAGTVAADDPLLTDRSGKPRHLPLRRIVLDESLRLPTNARLAASAREAPVMVFAGPEASAEKCEKLRAAGVEIVTDEGNGRELLTVLDALGRRSVQSLLVEGGATIAGKFIDANLINKVTFFLAPIIIGGRDAPGAIAGEGIEQLAKAVRLRNLEIIRRGDDLEVTGYPTVGNE